MPLPQKRWYRIADVARRWNMPMSDIEDYALDEMLQLSVFVVDVPVEATAGNSAATNVRSPQGMPFVNGPQPLQRTSLLEIFRDGQAEVRAFRTERPNKYLYVWSGTPAVVVRRDDLILTREERDRFEREHAVATGAAERERCLAQRRFYPGARGQRVAQLWSQAGGGPPPPEGRQRQRQSLARRQATARRG